MNGHVLRGTNIAVDYWKIKGRCDNFIHFLTHLHGDHIVGLTSSWQRPIYCSQFTAELLIKKHGLSESLLRVCPLNQAITVTECTSRSFIVTAYDANHCPGAVMFYFQGDFGNIFYTGDFRNSSQVIESCRHLINEIDTLYLDNTFCSPDCVFPSRDECFESIIDVVRLHPQHNVVIGVRKLGKETLLAKLGQVLNETICVSPMCYQISQMLFTTDVFTTVALNNRKCRIQTVSLHTISCKFVEDLNKINQTIAIIPSAIYTGLGCQPFCRDPNIFVVPYSDHCSFLELLEFVSALKPAKVLPIVRNFRGPFGVSLCSREDMSCFQSVLSKERPDRKVQKYGSDGNKLLTLDYHSQYGNDKLDWQSPVLMEKSNMTECSNLSSLLSSSLQQFGHPRSRRRHIRHVSHHLRRITRGVVYVNPVSDNDNVICVNPDDNGTCVNSVSDDNNGICVNPVSDDNNWICVNPVSDDNNGICVNPVLDDNNVICVSPDDNGTSVNSVSDDNNGICVNTVLDDDNNGICVNPVSDDNNRICVNPVSDDNNGICVNPDDNGTCVNPVSDNNGKCVNPVSDDNNGICMNPVLDDNNGICVNPVSDDNNGICVNPVSDDNNVTCVNPDDNRICVNHDNNGICVNPDDNGIYVNHVSDDNNVTCMNHDNNGICMNHDDNGICMNPDDNGICMNHDNNGICMNHDNNGICMNPDDKGICMNHDNNGICMNHDDNGLSVNPDDNGICVNLDGNGLSVNPVCDDNNVMCVDSVSSNSGIFDDDVCIGYPDSLEENNKKVKQQTDIGFDFTNFGGSLKRTVGYACWCDRKAQIKPVRTLNDQNIGEVNSNDVKRLPFRSSRTKFKPSDLYASSGLLLKHDRLFKPQDASIKQTKDFISALRKFVRD